jgi:hypothetical protein
MGQFHVGIQFLMSSLDRHWTRLLGVNYCSYHLFLPLEYNASVNLHAWFLTNLQILVGFLKGSLGLLFYHVILDHLKIWLNRSIHIVWLKVEFSFIIIIIFFDYSAIDKKWRIDKNYLFLMSASIFEKKRHFSLYFRKNMLLKFFSVKIC